MKSLSSGDGGSSAALSGMPAAAAEQGGHAAAFDASDLVITEEMLVSWREYYS